MTAASSTDPHRGAPAPAVGWSAGPLGAVQAADREIAHQTALRARAVAEFAASRPATVDRAQGEPGAMSAERWAARPDLLREVSEWAVQELVVALSISTEAAERLLLRSLTLVHRLPGTLRALEAGGLHVGHLWPMLEKVAPVEDPAVRAEVESHLLSWAAGRVTTPAQLGAKARRELLKRDALGAARRLARAIRERGVHLRPEGTDGMASVTAVLTLPEALALHQALGVLADALDDDPTGDPAVPLRTRGQKTADCLMDLVLRPGENDRPVVQLLLTVVASMGTVLGGDTPGEVDGHVVPAEMIRTLLRACAGHPEAAANSSPGCTPAPVPSREPDDARRCVDMSDPPSEGSFLADGGSLAECDVLWIAEDEDDLARWWADAERRVLTGELDGDPGPVPDDVLVRWATEGVRWQFPENPPGDPPPHDPLELDHTQHCSAPDRTATDETATDETAPTSAWWAAADRAVAEAGTAMRTAAYVLGHARRLVRTAGAADAAEEAAWRAGAAGRITAADDALAALAAASDAQRRELAALLDASGGGGLAERPRIALTDAVSGALLALTDLAELGRAGSCGARPCRRRPEACVHDLTGRPGLAPPGPTDGYRPGAALDRFVRARDRRCRFPGCRRRVPRGGELDHVVPHPAGPTTAANLTGFCTGHHRGKHQAPGWQHELAADGTVRVRTPGGLVASTTPPPY